MKNLKRYTVLASIASVSLISVGCGKSGNSIIEQAFEEAVNEEVNKRLEELEDNTVDNNSEDSNNINTSEKNENYNDVNETNKNTPSTIGNEGYLSTSMKEMEDYTVIFDADENNPYIPDMYKEIDIAYEAIKAVVNGDLENEVLVSDSYKFDNIVPLKEDKEEYDRIDKYIRSSRIQMDAEDGQKIDVKIREVEKEVSLSSKDDTPHVTLSFNTILTPEGGDSYMEFFTTYVYEQNGKLVVRVIV